jgi:hypothetical protein
LKEKLDPLRRYLMGRRPTELRLSLREIEDIIGAKLPPAATSARWWGAGRDDALGQQALIWQAVGYEAALSAFAPIVRFRLMGDHALRAGSDRREFSTPPDKAGRPRRTRTWRRDGVALPAPRRPRR